MTRSYNKVHWHCAETTCDNTLGVVIDGDLIVDLDSVVTVNTEGTSVVLTCAECGRAKSWFPDLDSSVIGATRAFLRSIRTER